MRTNDSRYLQPAMSVIANADPELFKAMQADDWPVMVIDEPDDLLPLIPRIGFGQVLAMADGLARGANALTGLHAPDLPAIMRGTTVINRGSLRPDARESGYDETRYLAYTLAHEYNHHVHDSDEPEAYAAGKAFALKMGDPDIARGSDEVGARVMRNKGRRRRRFLLTSHTITRGNKHEETRQDTWPDADSPGRDHGRRAIRHPVSPCADQARQPVVHGHGRGSAEQLLADSGRQRNADHDDQRSKRGDNRDGGARQAV